MSPNDGPDVTDDRKAIDENVRRIVGIAALRRIYRLIAEREREMRLLRTRVVPVVALATVLLAALMWLYFNPWAGAAPAPIPICPPPGSVAI